MTHITLYFSDKTSDNKIIDSGACININLVDLTYKSVIQQDGRLFNEVTIRSNSFSPMTKVFISNEDFNILTGNQKAEVKQNKHKLLEKLR